MDAVQTPKNDHLCHTISRNKYWASDKRFNRRKKSNTIFKITIVEYKYYIPLVAR